MSATETGRQIGVALKRKEDDPLLRGRGSFVDNIVIPGTLTMAVVRSPYAHAKITSIDTAAAKAADGVVAVFTGAELRDDWAAAMPCAWPVTEDMKSPEHFPLAVSEVHYQGDGVAVVIEAKHLCMMMRGVEKQNSVMKTSCLLGSFKEDARTRSEFLALLS